MKADLFMELTVAACIGESFGLSDQRQIQVSNHKLLICSLWSTENATIWTDDGRATNDRAAHDWTTGSAHQF